MTPEEFEPIGHFMGYAKQVDAWGETHWWSDNHDGTAKYIGLATTKTSLTPAECMEALERLVEKGYCPEMYYSVDSEGFAAWYFTENPCDRALYYVGRTANEAIEQCLKHLAAAIEGGKE